MAELNTEWFIFSRHAARPFLPRGHWEQSLPQVAQLEESVEFCCFWSQMAFVWQITTTTVRKQHRHNSMDVNVHFNCFIDLTINPHTNPYNLASSRLLWSVQPWHTNGYAYSWLCGTKNLPAICFSCSYQRHFWWSKFFCTSTEKTEIVTTSTCGWHRSIQPHGRENEKPGTQSAGAPNENIVQNHLNIELLNVF